MSVSVTDIVGALATAGVGGGIKWAVDRYLAARKEALAAASVDKTQDAERKAAERRERAERDRADRAADEERAKAARDEERAREQRAVEALAATAASNTRLGAAVEKDAEAIARIASLFEGFATTLGRIDARTETDDKAFESYRATTVAHRETQAALLAEARGLLVGLTTGLVRIEARLDALSAPPTGEFRAAAPPTSPSTPSAPQGVPRV